MPTSSYEHVRTVAAFLMLIRPSSILDVGLGNGKMGFIARDLLDVMYGQRYKKEDWKIRIDGIEVFPEYVQEHQKAIYDDIYIGDAFDVIDKVGIYDVIIIGDVLEHFEKGKAWQFLDKCAAHSGNYLIINIPLGEKWTQGEIYGNPHEAHLSFWSYEEFEPFVFEKKLFPFTDLGYYGSLLVKKTDYTHYRIIEEAERLYSTGKASEAISYMITSLRGLPPDIKSEYVLVDMLLRESRIQEAVDRVKTVVEAFPDEVSAKVYLEKLNGILNNNT